MKTKNELEKKIDDMIDEIELSRRLFEGLPVRATVKVVRAKRYNLKTGLPMDELERISVLRLWAPVARLPRNPRSPDDFEPALVDWEGFGG